MNELKLPITEADISKHIGRTIKSPIWIASLDNLGMNQNLFLDTFKSLFEELPWDPYDPRRLRVEYLKKVFPKFKMPINRLFKDYYTGKIELKAFNPWINMLSAAQKDHFDQIQSWRRRSVSQFEVWEEQEENIQVKRKPIEQFAQAVDDSDYRSWPRIFEEAPAKHVETPLFEAFLSNIFKLARKVYPTAKKVEIVAHFMSVKATFIAPGNNSPEGAHEDGADFIVSALVVNRKNIGGGISQIIEQVASDKKEIIYQHTLAPGEFLFQADTGEEKTYGNDLWHHVTPFHIKDVNKGDGWRDIIGFDINILEGKLEI